jgi:hypothetical protein
VSATNETALECRDGDFDLLSSDEEGVLAFLRTVVSEIRERGESADPEAVKAALVRAGATAGGDEPARCILEINGAKFSVRRGTGARDAIEISFFRD